MRGEAMFTKYWRLLICFKKFFEFVALSCDKWTFDQRCFKTALCPDSKRTHSQSSLLGLLAKIKV